MQLKVVAVCVYPGFTQNVVKKEVCLIVRITKNAVESMRRLDAGRLEYRDSQLKGFGIRASGSGVKSWFISYRIGGVTKRYTIGKYPAVPVSEARSKAQMLLLKVANGIDPSVEKVLDQRAIFFGDLSESFIENYSKMEKKSWKADARMLKKYVLPCWGNRRAKIISRMDATELLSEVRRNNGPIQSNRVLSLIRKIFNYGIDTYVIEVNPCEKMKRLAKERAREKVLKHGEILEVVNLAEMISPVLKAFVYLRFLTAQRETEILGASWSEIDLSRRIWTIPQERTKNGKAHSVPLSEFAVRVLKELRNSSGSMTWVFPSPRIQNSHRFDLKREKAQLSRSVDFDFQFRDIRRTSATIIASIGFSRTIVGKVLNHSEPEITAVYDRYYYDREKREALDGLARYIEKILSSEAVGEENHISIVHHDDNPQDEALTG